MHIIRVFARLGLLVSFCLLTSCSPTDPSSTAIDPHATQTPNTTKISTQAANPCSDRIGSLAFASYRAGESEIFLINPDGTALTQLTDADERVSKPAWSPDGKSMAYVVTDEEFSLHIYVMNADGSNQIQLTDEYWVNSEPSWDPTGTKIAFSTSRDSYPDIENDVNWGRKIEYEIYAMDADGSGQTNLTNTRGWDTAPSWSPDGSRIAFQSNRDGNPEIYVMNADGTGQVNLTNHPGDDATPAWSPDGSRIAFHSDRTGTFNIYTMKADGTGLVQLTSSPNWDIEADWSPDGRHIAFYSAREGNFEIYVMDQYGSCETRLTYESDFDGFPDWRP